MLDIRRMRVLLAVISAQSITAAARGLGYTPSAVSQQIAALEREAGLPLLERTPRGVRPTEAGRALSAYAADIGVRIDEAEAVLADLRAGRSGRVAVRYFAGAGAVLVAPAVAALRRERPGIHVDLRLTDPDDPLPEVREGRADLALVLRAGPTPVVEGVRFTHLCTDNFRVVLPDAHPLAARDDLELADLATHPWVGSAPPGPCLDAVLTVCAAAGFSPAFAVRSEDYVTAQAFVAAGLGVSLIPGLGLGDRPYPGVTVRDLRDPGAVRGVYAAMRDRAPAQPASTAMLEALRAAATRGNRPGVDGSKSAVAEGPAGSPS
ncbi:LysR family transcriptional regulator [Embleya sp. MST-111070]|uniref:LysR family transcriptional regulator n=1 Tax=Embleya sp. MST-111070 TaxID=3398231 RepID=UPI003F737DBE